MADEREVVVAIPTYDNEDTIGATLDVVFGQTRPPDRVVLCDKSNDDTRTVARERAAESDVDLEIVEQTSDGVAGAYDEILVHVGGEYDLFCTLQSDLTVEDDWLEGHLQVHREHPEIDVVNGDNKRREPTDREVTADERPYYVGRNFSAKAGTLERIDGWDRNFLRGEDWDMRIRLAGANVRSYAKTELGYSWQQSDPYITLSKAKRRPTSVSFLSKYGSWYLGYHPSHVVSDGLSVGLLAALVLSLLALPLNPLLSAAAVACAALFAVTYLLGHVLLRGGVDGSYLLGPLRKQLLNGVSVVYAIGRVVGRDVEWNTAGFDPENVPRYRF